MRILSSAEARRVDQHAVAHLGIPNGFLMGNAGLAVAEKAKKMLLENNGHRVSIVSGKGNNGGDGYSAAVRLVEFDADVTIFSAIPQNEVVGDAKTFHDQCIDLGIRIHHVTDMGSVAFSGSDLIIDGLLGTGIRGEVRPDARKWIDLVNCAGVPVLAIDVPSGVSADSGQVLGAAVRADATVTMGYLKQGLVMNPGAELAGDVVVAKIGYPEEAFEVVSSNKLTFEESLAFEYLQKPAANIYKHRQGKLLLLTGSTGFTGAGCLASEAALRAGAGLVIAGVPESLNPIFEQKLTEVITAPLPDGGKGCFVEDAVGHVGVYLDWCHAVAIGPGFGTNPSTLSFARQVVEMCDKPIVIDADALRPFGDHFDLFSKLNGNFIITPHYGEASALMGVDKRVIVDDPFKFAEETVARIGGVLVLKGAPTLIGFDSSVVAATSGHQGLATGGSGDVLTGIIGSFVAQGMPNHVAAQLGVFIHGKAADSLLRMFGYRGLLAGDLLNSIPSVISSYEFN